jgi:acetylglutamate/LysW-gamma-L-alpha-aminoadipate kinase
VYIVKIGGGDDLNLPGIVRGLKSIAEPMIIVHGANGVRDRLADMLGQQKKILTSVSGYPSVYSDEAAIDLLMMSYAGLRNKRLVELCQQNGLNAVGLTGLDGGIIRARRNQGIRVEENGRRRLVRDLSGKPMSIDRGLLDILLDRDFVPVLTVPLIDESGCAVNSENDEIVRLLQQTFQAGTVLQFIGAPGLLRSATDPTSLISRLDAQGCADLEAGLEGRILRKLRALHKLLDGSEVRVFIGDGRGPDPVNELLNGGGTVAVGRVA